MRKGDSMFAPFREKIIEMCSSGMTCAEMVKELPPGYSYQSLYTYIRQNCLREQAWEKIYDARNKCSECEYCKEIYNLTNKVVKSYKICSKSWRYVHADGKYCPKWCEKGRKWESKSKSAV